jgi:hypothetical protein
MPGSMVVGGEAAEDSSRPHFQEILRLIRANLDGVSEDELNRAAVRGLLDRFYPRVLLVTNEAPIASASGTNPVSRTSLFEKAFGYLRIPDVTAAVPEGLANAVQQLRATNALQGLVLDLRYADGFDYAAAAAVADRFLSVEKPLLSWGDTALRSAVKADAITLPTAVLINQRTVGAAEALAAALRENGAALLIGSRTAGQVWATKDFALADHQQLRIASTPVRAGDGKVLTGGVPPDFEVAVGPEEEKTWFDDPFKGPPEPVSRSSTNLRPRMNEAELVRRLREGLATNETGAPAAGRRPAPAEPVVRDPALARALDLLKGIAVVSRPGPS